MIILFGDCVYKKLAIVLPAILVTAFILPSGVWGASDPHSTAKENHASGLIGDSAFQERLADLVSSSVLVAQSGVPKGKIKEEKVSSRKKKTAASQDDFVIDPLAPDEGELKATKALSETEKEDLKKKYPCNPIYLSARGVCAGTGDPDKFAGAARKIGRGEHPLALELSDMPKDKFGLVDWAESLRDGSIQPWESLKSKRKRRKKKPLDLDIVIKAKSKFMHDVIYPHKIHTRWLSCDTCHPKIFKRKEGGNPAMTMPKITAGEYCGRCHNRVAFPLSDCMRCHVKPKESNCETRAACIAEAKQ